MNYIDIYKLLKKSNCGDCGTPTCMAFALSVIKGERGIEECPHLDKTIADQIKNKIVTTDWKEELIDSLKKEVSKIDFERIAEGIGAKTVRRNLNIKCLGIEYQVDGNGNIRTKGHINPWIKILLLHYIRTGGRSKLSGRWVSFAELKGGMVKAQSFARDCEDPLRRIIDRHADHFFDILSVLSGKPVEGQPADYAWIIYPLPKVPFLILYRRPDEDFDSTLKILFDATADEYLDVESLIFLGEGLVEMFKRIISKHG